MPTKSSSISIAPPPVLQPATIRRSDTDLPCRDACPVGTHAGGYVSLISRGHYREAYVLARKSNPFASICGRICEHPCESACRRQQIDAPVSIRALNRFATERYGVESNAGHAEILKVVERPRPRVEQGGNVAIVGAGPAGLACAHDLALMGHKTIVFDATSVAGDLMRLGIPDDRLPRELIEKEVDFIRYLGVDIRLGVQLGVDMNLRQLRRDYDAVFLATGQMVGSALPGEEHGLEITPHNTISVDRDTLATSSDGIYAGGDVAFGSRLVIEAVADGRHAARSIDTYLTGRGDRPPSLILKRSDTSGHKHPLVTRCLQCWVIPVFDSHSMSAIRCMQCAECVDVCPENSIDLVSLLSHPPGEGLFPTLRLPDGRPLSIIAKRGAALIKDATTCTRCGLCAQVCPTDSITMQGFYRADEEILLQLCEKSS